MKEKDITNNCLPSNRPFGRRRAASIFGEETMLQEMLGLALGYSQNIDKQTLKSSGLKDGYNREATANDRVEDDSQTVGILRKKMAAAAAPRVLSFHSCAIFFFFFHAFH